MIASLSIFGKRKGFKIGAGIFFPDQEECGIVRIFNFDMNQFVFREMVSEWLSPDDYKWEYRLVCEDDPEKHCRIKPQDLAQYDAKPLWLRAFVQLQSGPKLQIVIGCAPAVDIKHIPAIRKTSFQTI